VSRWTIPAVLCAVLITSPAVADRVQVYSVQGVDCGDCGTEIKAGLKKLKGVKKAEFDMYKAEVTIRLADGVTDAAVIGAIQRSGHDFRALVGPGKGAYLPAEKYPEGTDVVHVTNNGSAVGPLEKLRVPGKYTVFDLYADWCGPCRSVDAKLRETVSARKDVAVRKLNVVRFDSPLAREFGPRLKSLPYVVVFSPAGKRIDIVGADFKKLAAALQAS